MLSTILGNKTLIKRLRHLKIENKAWWDDAGVGWRNTKYLSQFLTKVKALEALDLSDNAFTPKVTLNILSDLIRSDTLINLESLEMKGSSFDMNAVD